MTKTLEGQEALDLFISQMIMKLSVPRMLWMGRYNLIVLKTCQLLQLEMKHGPVLILQVMLGRPLRISFALGRVRGASVIVPRLSTVRKNSNDVFVHFVPRNRSTPAISV
jgi:hypothetical protein